MDLFPGTLKKEMRGWEMKQEKLMCSEMLSPKHASVGILFKETLLNAR